MDGTSFPLRDFHPIIVYHTLVQRRFVHRLYGKQKKVIRNKIIIDTFFAHAL